MKIVVDENIPLLKEMLEPYAEVVYAPAKSIDAAMIHDANALLIRTRTQCNAALLENSQVKFIGTATIGTDHIDLNYCRKKKITVAPAAGCNAGGVMQYVTRTLVAFEEKVGKDLRNCTIGIVGVGNVGKRVQQAAQAIGARVLLNDPPRAAREGAAGFVSLNELLLKSDIVTLHVPLDSITESLANAEFFGKMKLGAGFINTSRGEVVDDGALLKHCSRLSFVALDVWRNEPDINLDLVKIADIATPHIAGYSIQGKRNATTMVVRALAQFFNIEPLVHFFAKIDETATLIDFSVNKNDLYASISENYTIFEDDKQLRNAPQNFEQLRNNYKLRNEFVIKKI